VNRRLRLIWLLLFAASCSEGSYGLTIDVRSDLAPGVDITEVRTTLSSDVEVVRTALTPVAAGDPLAEGFRVAEFTDVPAGQYEVDVVGRGPSGSVSRRGIVVLSADAALVYTLPSACVAIVCPGSGDDPAATDCDDGMCVVPPCVGVCTPMDASTDVTIDAPDTSPPPDTSVDTSPPDSCPDVVSRYDVSMEGVGGALFYARTRRPSPPAVVIVTFQGDPAFGNLSQATIPAVGLARRYAAPLIFSATSNLRGDVRTYLMENRGSINNIFIVGGDSSISPGVQSEIAAMSDWGVIRIGGGGFADTARDIANRVGVGDGRAVIIRAAGTSLPDGAVAAAAAAAVARRPLLFVNRAEIPPETNNWFVNHPAITAIDVIGPTSDVLDTTVEMLGRPYTRYADADAFAHAVSISSGMAPSATRAGLVPLSYRLLALSVGAVGHPVLLVDSATLPTATADYLRASPIVSVDLMGPLADPDAIERALCPILVP